MEDRHLGADRLRLAPGLRVVRRGRDRLQVGLHPERRALLPRDQATESVLARLLRRRETPAGARPVQEPPPEERRVLDELERGGCLVADRRGEPPLRVLLEGAALVDEDDLARLLRDAGLRPVQGDPADVVLVVAEGEPDRDRLDHLVRRGHAHLLVRLVDGGAVLGPFVQTGRTACLRCLDAHLALRDPDHVVVAARYRDAVAVPRPDGPDRGAGPALATAHLAVAWAVADLAAYAGGQEPSTWSRTVRLLGREPLPTVESWAPHPLCGCTWSWDDRPWGTMEA